MTLQEFIEKNMAESGYVVASFTDRYVVDCWPTQEPMDEKKLLEIRVFNEDMESKLFRSDLGKQFLLHEVNDREEKRDYMDDWQYLDIDTKKSEESFTKNGRVFTTGGGMYKLPIGKMENAGVLVRSYFEKSKETGMARISGFRLVTFGEVK